MEVVKDLLNNDGFVALIGALFGGIGLDLARRLFDRKQRRNEEVAKAKAELRADIESLRQQLTNTEADEQRLEAELERWKGLYYETREEMLRNLTELETLKVRISVLESTPRVTLERQAQDQV